MKIIKACTGVDFIKPESLFNLLNQEFKYPCISDSVYMLLLDARLRKNYEESHIVTAKFVKKNALGEYLIPNDYELSCKTHVIVYDLDTSTVKPESMAFDCALVMWKEGSRNTVKVLEGGYKLFSSMYPFLRTRKIIYLPRELDLFQTYPCEIIRGRLYLGRRSQAEMAYIQRDLNIDRHVNCSVCPSSLYPSLGRNIISLSIKSFETKAFYPKLQTACNFIDLDYNTGGSVLVYSEFGTNRSAAIVVAYVIYTRMCSYEEAMAYVRGRCPRVCICRLLTEQLWNWAKDVQSNPFAIKRLERSSTTSVGEPQTRDSKIEVKDAVASSAYTIRTLQIGDSKDIEEEDDEEEKGETWTESRSKQQVIPSRLVLDILASESKGVQREEEDENEEDEFVEEEDDEDEERNRILIDDANEELIGKEYEEQEEGEEEEEGEDEDGKVQGEEQEQQGEEQEEEQKVGENKSRMFDGPEMAE